MSGGEQMMQQIVQATQVLNNPSQNQRDLHKQAENFLKKFQATPEAWDVANKLLQQPNLPLEAHFFAAQTLQMKVRRQIQTLPEGSREAFRNSLMEHIITYSYKPDKSTIQTQLSIAIASFAVQFYEQWRDSVHFFVETLHQKHDQSLLVILEMIPDECRTDVNYTVITGNKYIGLLKHFGRYVPQVLNLLKAYLLNSGTRRPFQKRIFACFDRWVAFCDDEPPRELLESPLLTTSFQALQVPELFEACVEAIISVIARCERRPYEPVMRKIFPLVLGLGPMFSKTFEGPDIETAKGLCRIFNQAGDSFRDVILQGGDEARKLLHIIIKIMSYPDHDVAAISFNFWPFFCGDIRSIMQPNDDERKIRIFIDILLELLKTLSKAMELPHDYERMDEQTQKDLHRFRGDCADTLREVGSCLPQDLTMKVVHDGIVHGFRRNQANPADTHELEAWLYCLRAVSPTIQNEDKILPQVFSMISKFPKNPEIRYTMTTIVGRFSYWVRNNTDQFLTVAFQYVIEGLNIKTVETAAAQSFKFLCESCPEAIMQRELLPYLYKIYEKSHCLGSAEQNDIIEGIVLVYAILPPDQFPTHLREMAKHASSGIRAQATYQDVANALERVGSILKSVYITNIKVPDEISHPVVDLYVEMKAIYEQVLEFYCADEPMMEKVVKCIRYTCKCRPTQFADHVVPILGRIENANRKHAHSCFLYLASIFVGEYANFPQFQAIIQKVLEVFVKPTSARLRDRHCFAEHPDMAEDFFRLTGRYITVCPDIMFQSKLFAEVFQCGIVGLSLHQYDALSVIINFFTDFIHKALPKRNYEPQKQHVEFVHSVLAEYGSRLASAVCYGVWDLPHVGVTRLQRIMEALLDLSREATAKWLQDGLTSMDYYDDQEAKENFFTSYIHAKDERERLEIVRQLERACDAYRYRSGK